MLKSFLNALFVRKLTTVTYLKLSPKKKKLEVLIDEVETCACQKSLLLYNSKQAFESFLSKYPELSDPFNAIISSHIETYLSNIPFLKDIKPSRLTLLATMCKYEALDSDQIVFQENTPGDKLYILLSGKASVLAPQWVGNATVLQQSLEWGAEKSENERDNNNVVVAGLKSGDYFGETALFVNVNRTSTVRTKEKSLFVTVEKKTFENFCVVCPQIKDKMTNVMKERMVSKLSSLGIPFLIGIPAKNLKSLTDLVEIHETSLDEVIFREGDAGDRFYIIIHGQVIVEKAEESEEGRDSDEANENDRPSISREKSKRLGVLNAGNYFGEMALVSDLPRSATVTAIEKTILLSVNKDSFGKIFASNEAKIIRAEFNLRLLGGSSELKHLLAHSLGVSTFRTFMKRSVAEENLDFWIAAREFKKGTEEKDALKRSAIDLFERFCKEGSDHQVNLPCSIRSPLDTAIKDDKIDSEMFEKAEDEIYRLMVRDNYARFKRTPDFKEFFKCLGILVENTDDG